MAEAPDWDDIPDFDNLPDAAPTQSDGAAASAPPAAQSSAPDWDAIPDFDSLPDQAPAQPEGVMATAARKAAHGALPTVGALPAIAAGAALGSVAGPVGTFLGGVAGGIGGGALVSAAQEFALHSLGYDDSAQMAANAEAHPIASAAGDLIPAAAAFRFDKGASALARVGGGALMGGLDVAQQKIQTGRVDPYEAAGAAAGGALLTKPTKLGQRGLDIGEAGAARVRTWINGKKANPALAAPLSGDDATPQTSGGASVADVPPNARTDVGDAQNQPTRSDRDYGVQRPASDNSSSQPTIGDMDPSTLAALQNSLDQNELRAVPADASELPNQPKPESVPPIQTGIVDAAAQQAAPQQPDVTQQRIDTGLTEAPPVAQNAQPTASFQTSKGSTYQVRPDGTTVRTKSDHTAEGHAPDDVGEKPPSDKTVYMTREQASALQPPPNSGNEWGIIDHGNGTLSTAMVRPQNKRASGWGISPSQKNITYSTEPAVGLHPVELNKPGKILGQNAFGQLHIGNDIVSTAGPEPVVPRAEHPPAGEPPPWEALPDKAPAPPANGDGVLAASQMQREATQQVAAKNAAQNEGGAFQPEKTGSLNPDRAAAPVRPPAAEAAIAKSKRPKLSLPERAAAEAPKVNPEPSPAQIEAGNYAKGHPGKFAGHDVSVENTEGSIRRSKPGEPPWEAKMPHDYGYLRDTIGADGDPLDIAIGKGNKHFIIDQQNAETGAFDEHKIMAHFKSQQDAVKSYKASFSDGKGDQRLMGIMPVSEDTIRSFAEKDHSKDPKPFGGEPAKNVAVTAAVKAPAVVRKTLADLRAAGMEKAAAAIEALPPDRRVVEAAKANAILTNKKGEVTRKFTGENLRNRSKPPEVQVGDVTVTARTKADAERKAGALARLNAVFEKYAPTENETRDQTRERLEKAVQDIGNARSLYRPNVKPKEWMWARDAEKFLKGSMSENERQKFIANELQLRSGHAEDVENVRNTGRIDSDVGMSRRSGEDAIAQHEKSPGYIDVPHEEAETMVEPREIKTAADLGPKRENRELDLTDPDALAKVKTDNQKVVDNLIKAEDKPSTEKPLWETEHEQRVESMDKQRRAREAAELAGRKSDATKPDVAAPVRKIAIDDQSAKAALAALAKAEARAKSRDAEKPLPPEKEVITPEQAEERNVLKSLKALWGDERGSVDLKKITKDYKAGVSLFRGAMEKYFGVPVGDVGIKADSVFARSVTEKNKWQAEKAHLLDARTYQWSKNPNMKEDGRKWLSTVEDPQVKTRQDAYDALIAKGVPAEKADWMADDVQFHKALMDKIFLNDKAHGSQAGYVDNYVSHIFEDHKGATAFMNQRIEALGPRWYQKSRVFDLISEAEAADFKLKYDNPMQIINARWAASINANMLVATARGLHNIGLAFPSKDAPSFAKKWTQVSLPDGQVWHLAPETENLWTNAMDAKGLAENQHIPGSLFRAWMKLKNVWVPFQLFFSGFHELHIAANINPAVNLSRALQLSRHDPASAGRNFLNAAKWSLTEPLLSLPIDKIGYGFGKAIDNWSGKAFSEFAGRKAMNWWQQPPESLDATGKMWTQLFKEGGMSPFQAEEERINAKRAFRDALNQGQYGKAILPGIRRAMETIQEPMFKYQIPALKNIAYMRNVEAAFKMDPSLINDNVKRGVVLRDLGKNIDDRFGEMFYKGLFWNKYVKDAGIGSMLSLSWNLGQVRQAGGAVMNLRRTARLAGGANGMGSPMQEVKYRAGDKGTFVSSYVAFSMATAGIVSAALTGEVPTGLDYFFPRNGLKNNDGSPARLSTPFNTREPFMLAGHAQQHNSWVGGAMEFLWNKMILAPLVEVAQNKDFYGNKLYDTNAPWYKKALQVVDSTLGNHMSVVSLSGADRAKQLGGGAGMQAMAYAGFAPAPKYISATPMENRINALFADEGTPYNRPYEYGDKTGLGKGLVQGAIRSLADDPLQSEARRDAHQRLDRASVAGDQAAAMAARRDMVTKGHLSPRTAGKLGADQEFQDKFARLPEATQLALSRDFTAQEFNRYVLTNKNAGIKRETRSKIIKERGLLSR